MERTRKKGFTIVELLTVMGVIAVLIGLMVPALGLVKDYSKRIQQKAQFHGIDMGLEMYKTEFGSYPRSDDNNVTGKEAVNHYSSLSQGMKTISRKTISCLNEIF